MQSESLDHSLDSGHANPCLLADELRAGARGSGPQLTLPLPLTIASPLGCLAPVRCQLSLCLSGPVCGPPPCLSCRGGRPTPAPSQTPVPRAAVVSAASPPP